MFSTEPKNKYHIKNECRTFYSPYLTYEAISRDPNEYNKPSLAPIKSILLAMHGEVHGRKFPYLFTRDHIETVDM